MKKHFIAQLRIFTAHFMFSWTIVWLSESTSMWWIMLLQPQQWLTNGTYYNAHQTHAFLFHGIVWNCMVWFDLISVYVSFTYLLQGSHTKVLFQIFIWEQTLILMYHKSCSQRTVTSCSCYYMSTLNTHYDTWSSVGWHWLLCVFMLYLCFMFMLYLSTWRFMYAWGLGQQSKQYHFPFITVQSSPLSYAYVQSILLMSSLYTEYQSKLFTSGL